MKKLPEQFSVYAKTIEEANYICKKQKEMCGGALNEPTNDMFYRFSPNQTWDKWGYSSSSYINNLPEYNIQHEFTFEEFKSYFEKEFVLPEMWCINFKRVSKEDKWWFITQIDNSYNYNSYHNEVCSYYHFNELRSVDSGHTKLYKNYTEITFEQFKKYVLKENHMEKKIVGYKLIKPEFEKAASEIVGDENGCTNFIRCREYQNYIIPARNFDINLRILKESGVLDLWFEPVYKDEKQDIVLTLTNGKQVTVTKEGKIMAEGSEFNNIELRKLYAFMFESFEHINGLKISANSINIGCWKNIEAKDLKLILETQEKQSK